MDPEEMEFLSEKTLVSIVPTFSSDPVRFISGNVGPFRAGLPIRVPIWIAINLKEQQKCKILAPDWMDIETLNNIKEHEKNTRTFTKMPSEHYMVETKLLLAKAAEDIPKADEIRTIVKDIWDIRMSKLRSSIDVLIQAGGIYAAVDHLTILEINSIRPLLPFALDQIYRMKKASRPGGSQSQNSTTFGQSNSKLPTTPFRT